VATKLNGPPDIMMKMRAIEPKAAAQLVLNVIKGERDADQGKVVFKDTVESDHGD
jgi:hypothetical protein